MFSLERIEGISPSRPKPGSSDPPVPHLLYDALFGPCEDDAVNSFAVLDAASVDGLPEMLEASGLEHVCLFQGKAADELGDAAPWLVRLEPESALTRRLFTSGQTPWHLWGKISGSYMCFAGSCRDLAKHLRYFTRLPDENGKWYYFRYWDPPVIEVILNNPLEPLSERFLARLPAVATVFAERSRALNMRRAGASAMNRNSPVQMTQRFQRLLGAAAADRFDDKLRRYIMRHDKTFARLSPDDQLTRTRRAVATAEFYDFRIEAAVAQFARLYLTTPQTYFETRAVRDIPTSARHELVRVNDLAQYFKIKL